MIGPYEIRVITNGVACEDALVELVTEGGPTIRLNPKSIRFEGDGEGPTLLSLTFFGNECRIIHTPYSMKPDAASKPDPTPMPGEPGRRSGP